MWTQMDERSMPEFETPEVLQSPLDEVVLLLAGMGIAQPQNFSWLTVPSSAPFSKAIEELRLIGAVDSSGAITDLGQKILGLPTSPRLGKLLLTARANGLPDFGARACAVLSERDFLKNPPNSSSESDLLDRTEVIERSGAGKRVYQQLLVRNGAKDRSTDLNETLFEVFSDRLARRRSKGQKNAVLISGRGVTLHDHSQVKQSEFFLCLQLQTTAQSDDPVVFWAHGLPTDFVIKKLKTKASLKKSLRFDKENLQFWTDEALAVGHFVIEEARQRKATSEEIGSALSERLFENWDWFLSKNIALSRWWSRYRFFCTQENLPTLTEAELRSVLELACYGENALAPLFEKDVVYFLEQALESDLILRLNSAFYPAYLQVPSGRSHWIDYSAGVPKLEVKLQELFGLTETPRLGAKNLPLTLVMLSPNGSPMQTTQDLESFWSKGYFEVRADLRSRYPKHPWPDDPLTAQATHKTKKQR
jgi:ATP-dependent helicase HrpB